MTLQIYVSNSKFPFPGQKMGSGGRLDDVWRWFFVHLQAKIAVLIKKQAGKRDEPFS